VRDKKKMQIKWQDVLVGDLIKIKVGMKIDCDGLLVQGTNVTTDESSVTGETRSLRKSNLEHCLEEIERNKNSRSLLNHTISSPIIVSGSTI